MFGERERLWRRLRGMSEARKLEADEVARRERPPRVSSPTHLNRAKPAGQVAKPAKPVKSAWRKYWWLIWLALGVGRVVMEQHGR